MNFNCYIKLFCSDLVGVQASQEFIFGVALRLTARNKLKVSSVEALGISVKFRLARSFNLFKTVIPKEQR